MKFQIKLTPSAQGDLAYFRSFEQKIILQGIKKYLTEDAHTEMVRKKRLRPNPLAPWELKLGDYRIFYDLETEASIKIIAIGYKEHNELFIRGRKLEL